MAADGNAGQRPREIPDRDLGSASNVELVRRVRDHADGEAEAALLARHIELITRVVQAECFRQRLSRSDWLDAVQESYLAFRKAITRYPCTPPDQTAEDGFPPFLATVVATWVKDFARRVRWHDRHYNQLPGLGSHPRLAGCAEGVGGEFPLEPFGHEPNPEIAAERGEVVDRVQHAIQRQPAPSRRLLRLLLAGLSLRRIARLWKRPYGRVKRLWHTSKRKLSAKLGRLFV
jgi:RNA polymerase sigma factor (sigma-70 family)